MTKPFLIIVMLLALSIHNSAVYPVSANYSDNNVFIDLYASLNNVSVFSMTNHSYALINDYNVVSDSPTIVNLLNNGTSIYSHPSYPYTSSIGWNKFTLDYYDSMLLNVIYQNQNVSQSLINASPEFILTNYYFNYSSITFYNNVIFNNSYTLLTLHLKTNSSSYPMYANSSLVFQPGQIDLKDQINLVFTISYTLIHSLLSLPIYYYFMVVSSICFLCIMLYSVHRKYRNYLAHHSNLSFFKFIVHFVFHTTKPTKNRDIDNLLSSIEQIINESMAT